MFDDICYTGKVYLPIDLEFEEEKNRKDLEVWSFIINKVQLLGGDYGSIIRISGKTVA